MSFLALRPKAKSGIVQTFDERVKKLLILVDRSRPAWFNVHELRRFMEFASEAERGMFLNTPENRDYLNELEERIGRHYGRMERFFARSRG
jgi:hypothetical protein